MIDSKFGMAVFERDVKRVLVVCAVLIVLGVVVGFVIGNLVGDDAPVLVEEIPNADR